MHIKRFYNDLETTGVDSSRNGIIQFSAIVTIDGEKVDSLTIKMQPFPDDEIDEGALEANGVSREGLFSEDRLTPDDAYREIIAFLAKHVDKFNRSDKFFWIGYNADFDARFTRRFFEKMGDNYFGSWFFMPILCVMVLAGYLLMKQRQKLKDFKLKTVYGFLYPAELAEFEKQAQSGEDPWHDALFDIERTIDVETGLRKSVSKG